MTNDSDLPVAGGGSSSLATAVRSRSADEIDLPVIEIAELSIAVSTPRKRIQEAITNGNSEAVSSSRRTRRVTLALRGVVDNDNGDCSGGFNFDLLLPDSKTNHVPSPTRPTTRLFRPCPRRPGLRGSDESIALQNHHQLVSFEPLNPMPLEAAAVCGGVAARHGDSDPFLRLEECESLFLDVGTFKKRSLPSFVPDLEFEEMVDSPIRLSMKPIHPSLDLRFDATGSSIQWISDATKPSTETTFPTRAPELPWSTPTSYPSSPEGQGPEVLRRW